MQSDVFASELAQCVRGSAVRPAAHARPSRGSFRVGRNERLDSRYLEAEGEQLPIQTDMRYDAGGNLVSTKMIMDSSFPIGLSDLVVRLPALLPFS